MRKTVIGGGIALAMALAPAGALAQDDMSEDDMMMGAMVPHPSHIHTGDCSSIGDIIEGLSDVAVVGNDAQGAASAVRVDIGLTSIGTALADLLAADHSIVVHQSAEDLTPIVCGAVGGHDVDGSFLVGLGAFGDSGYSGLAWLTDNGDGTTGVSVTISRSGATESTSMDDDMDDMSDDSMDDMSDDMDDDSMDDDE